MEFDAAVRRAFCCGNSEEKKAALPLECSIVLPDYFPDVMKILRYTAKTVKSPVYSEEGGEKVSGCVNIEVNYVSEEGELCSCSQLHPFEHKFEVTGKIAAAEAEVCVGELGCRAVNQRRIDLHGSIEVLLRVLCAEEKEFVSSVSGAGAVEKSEEAETVLIAGEYSKSFTLEEKGELGYGKPPFGKILRSSAGAQVTECHVIQDKIVTKGEVRVSVLWQPEREEESEETGPFLSEFVFPVSRMVDANGILMTDICDAGYAAEFPEITPESEGRELGIRVKINIFARAYRKETLKYVKDMFSSEYETKTEKEKLCVINEAVPVVFTENIIESPELPESAETVTDIWVEALQPKLNHEGKIAFTAKICMFAKDEDENPLYFEKTVERELNTPFEGKNIAFYNLSADVKNCEFGFGKGKKAEVSAAVLIDGTVYTAMSTEAIASCSINEDKKIKKDSSAMILCYAEKGEYIWDIAKKYRVPMEDILSENGLLGEVLLEKTMLVIPG